MKMLRYEIKKVFSKSKNRIAVIVLFVILAITSILTINRVTHEETGRLNLMKMEILLLEFRLQEI